MTLPVKPSRGKMAAINGFDGGITEMRLAGPVRGL
jgi:hypothetical protein